MGLDVGYQAFELNVGLTDLGVERIRTDEFACGWSVPVTCSGLAPDHEFLSPAEALGLYPGDVHSGRELA
jgi:hypothetical protein